MTSETKHIDLSWGDSTADPSLEVLLEQTFNYPRIEILRFLRSRSGETTTLDDLAARLCDWEAERRNKRPERDRMVIKLHHNHLPALADAGVIKYDSPSKEVHYKREENGSVESLLSQLTG